MGTGVLGGNIKAAIDALAAIDKQDRTKLMEALGNPIEDWVDGHGGSGGYPVIQTPILDYQSSPPGSPSANDVYIVQPTVPGAWAGHDNSIATYVGGVWTFRTPAAGTLVYVVGKTASYKFTTSWAPNSQTLASNVITDTTNFGGVLSSADTTVQAALETIDDLPLVAGSESAGFVKYTGTTKTSGCFYGGTAAPGNLTRLNYDGNFSCSNLLLSGGIEITYSGFVGVLSTDVLTASRAWVLPNYNGTVAMLRTAGDATAGSIQYNNTATTAGQFNGGAVAPTATTRLNYEGNLYATNFMGTIAASYVTQSASYRFVTDTEKGTWNGKKTAYTNLTSIGGLANAAGWLHNNGSGTFTYSTPSKTDVGLGNVTNDAQIKSAAFPSSVPDGYRAVFDGITGKKLKPGGEVPAAISLVTAGSATVGAVQYNGTTQATGQWDGGSTTPSHTTRLNFDGYLYCTALYSSSSLTIKENIRPFAGSALMILKRVGVISYNLIADPFKEDKVGFGAENEISLLAGRNHDRMDIPNVIGLLIKAVQELSERL